MISSVVHAFENHDLANNPISKPNDPRMNWTKFESMMIALLSTPGSLMPPPALIMAFTYSDTHHPNHTVTQTYPKTLVHTLYLSPKRLPTQMSMSSRLMMSACKRKNGIE